MPLTDVAVRNAKPGDRIRKLADSGNLYLAVAPTGTKSWRMDYSYLGKRKTLSFGTYPATTLSEAREKRDAAKRNLEANKDPAVVKRREKLATLAANGNTFGVIADEFLSKLLRDGRAGPTITKNTWMLNELASPLRSYPITDISAKDILEVLRAIEKSGRVESALATRATIGRVFRHAIATARAESDPTSALRGALQRHVPRNHPAITDVDKVGGLMRAIYGYEGWPSLCDHRVWAFRQQRDVHVVSFVCSAWGPSGNGILAAKSRSMDRAVSRANYDKRANMAARSALPVTDASGWAALLTRREP